MSAATRRELAMWAVLLLAICVGMWARMSRGDVASLADLLPETVIEYRDPPPTVCGNELGVNIRFRPATNGENPDLDYAFGDTIHLRVACGTELIETGAFPVLADCTILTGKTERDGVFSDEAVISSATSECQPVPEPAPRILLGVGLVGLAVLGRRRA